jgi:hypothetical protein
MRSGLFFWLARLAIVLCGVLLGVVLTLQLWNVNSELARAGAFRPTPTQPRPSLWAWPDATPQAPDGLVHY